MPSRRAILVAAAGAFLALILLGNLDATLRQMHLPGGVSGGVTDIASPTTSHDDATTLIRSWRGWGDYLASIDAEPDVVRDERAPLVEPGPIVAWWLVIDSLLFAPLLALTFFLAALRRVHAGPERWLNWLAIVPRLLLLYLVLDLAENVATAAFVFGPQPWFHLVRGASGLKLLVLVLSVLPIGLSIVLPGGAYAPEGSPRFREVFFRLRVPVVMVGVLGAVFLLLPGGVRPQLADIVRTWVPGDDVSALAWAVGMLAGFMVVVWLAGVVAIRTTESDADPVPTDRRHLLLHVGVPTLIIVVGGLVEWQTQLDIAWPAALVVGGGWLVNTAGLLFQQAPQLRPGDAWDATTALCAIAAAPALFFSALVLRSVDLSGPWRDKWLLLVVAGTATAVFVGLVLRGTEIGLPSARTAIIVVTMLGGAGAITAIWLVADLVERSWFVGATGILLLAAVIATAFFALFEYNTNRPPAGLLAVLGVQRVPLFSVVVGVFLITGAVNSQFDFHLVRPTDEEVGTETLEARRGIDLTQAVESFERRVEVDGGPNRIEPLFVVASSGGGARAAYWTALITNCLFGGSAPPGVAADAVPCDGEASWDQVFLASGISGGSVGLALYAAVQTTSENVVEVDDVFGDGGVDPVIASMLFVDLPNGILTHDSWTDRAARLEEAWERKLPAMEEGLFASQLTEQLQPVLPVLLLNSASIVDGCRLNVSVVDLVDESTGRSSDDAPAATCHSLERFERRGEPGRTRGAEIEPRPLAATRDINDYVCTDLRLSTAALLSARFPFVSPMGALEACAGSNARRGHRTYAGDGGYVDSSAASPVFEMLDTAVHHAQDRLPDETCVQPVVLQIDNGYEALTAPKDDSRPRELLAPLVGFGTAAGSRADAARHALAIEATRPRCSQVGDLPTYLHIYPRARPGIEAPLGWSLSSAARDDLKAQIASNANVAVLCNAQRWLTSTERECAAPHPDRPPLADERRLPGGSWLVVALVLLLLVVPFVVLWLAARVLP